MQCKQGLIGIPFVIILLSCIALKSNAQGGENEKAVKAYYSGFETHNWNLVASQLAKGFTFTTPIMIISQLKNSKTVVGVPIGFLRR